MNGNEVSLTASDDDLENGGLKLDPTRNGRRATIMESVKLSIVEQKESLLAVLVKLYGRLRLRYIIPTVCLIIYSCLGGLIFMYAEQENDLNQRRGRYNDSQTAVDKAIRQVLWRAAEIEALPRSARTAQMRTALVWLAKQAADAQLQPVTDAESPWNFWGSLFFAGTVYTTIGYGNYSPVTTGGRIAVVFYALFGIPMVMTILNDLGHVMILAMRLAWWRIWRTFKFVSTALRKRLRRRKSQLSLVEDEDSEFQGDEHDDSLPISGALLVFTFWMSVCAAIFTFIEPSWTYAECLYFFFVSLTTIGFGDMVPHDTRYAPITIPLLILGLSVISMCINVIQMRIEQIFKKLAQSIDSEYKSGQSGDDSLMSSGAGGLGVLQLYRRQNFSDKILYKMMNKNLKGVLEERFEQRSRMRNKGVQAGVRVLSDAACQWDEEDEEAKKKKSRKYIYNCDD